MSNAVDDLRGLIANMDTAEAIRIVRETRESISLQANTLKNVAHEMTELLYELEGPPVKSARVTGYTVGKRN